MFLPNHLLVILMLVPILVDCSPHIVENHQQHTALRKPCPKGPQPRGGDQDTIFPNCDFGVDRIESIGIRLGKRNSTSHLDVVNNPDSNHSQANEIIQATKPVQTSPLNFPEQETGRQPGCTMLPDPGQCRGAFPRYYYNQNIDQCDCFLFGGCDEELVVFTWLTFQECLYACVPGNTAEGPRCEQASFEDVQRFLSSTENPVNKTSNEVIRGENNSGSSDIIGPRFRIG